MARCPRAMCPLTANFRTMCLMMRCPFPLELCVLDMVRVNVMVLIGATY